jgi:hypothetical protein
MASRRIHGPALVVLLLAVGCGLPSGCSNVSAGLEGRGEELPVAGRGFGLAGLDEEAARDARGGGRQRLTAFAGEDPAGAPAAPAPAPEVSKRLMVYTARYEVIVASVKDAVGAFLAKAEGLGGYLESREDARVTVRVPAARFQELLAMMPSFGLVAREDLKALDVTKQYTDLGLRLGTAEKARERLVALLARAEKVEDILKIEAEVRRLDEEIERLKGEIRFLSDRIAWSTLEVLFRSSAPEPVPLPRRALSRFPWINKVGVEHVLEEF